ncbi:MAG: 3-methyl-2-oxobutanoate hydroxymethyltransferase [Vicinamibacterales bacterium]
MESKKMRVPDFTARKRRGEKIVMLTAYDATMARLLDRAGVDALLVGDSLGTVILGLETTLPVTLDAVVHHTRAVVRGAERAFVIADMPFLTFQISVAEAVRNAGRLLQEGGAAAVKLEGGRPVADVVKRLVDVGIPVMGHLGLQPQSVHHAGGYVKQATQPAAVDALMIDALALQDAGAFSLVLESIPADVARTVTGELAIPTIGIGAGPDCDGQILVSYDMLGLFDGFVPSFVHQYAKLGDAVTTATREYAADVRAGRYPQRAKPVTAPHVAAGSSSSGQ